LQQVTFIVTFLDLFSPCHAGLSESHTSATRGGSEAWHSFGFLQQLVPASLGTTQHALKHVYAVLLLHLLLDPSDWLISSLGCNCHHGSLNISDDAGQLWQLFNCSQVERLGDAKQQVRDAVAAALQAILSSWGLQTVLPMLTSAWAHRNPRVKQGTLQVVTDAITVMPIALSLPATWLQLVLQPAAKLLDDPNR